MYQLDTHLYWSLPGPDSFSAKVARAIASARMVVVNLPYNPPQGFWEQIVHGARGAHLGAPIWLAIDDGVSIESAIGVHLDQEEHYVAAHRLATMDWDPEPIVILDPKSAQAQKRCEDYAKQFVESCHEASVGGKCRLVLPMNEDHLGEGRSGASTQVVRFDGTLDESMMHAYVALCMANRNGPGSTRLLASIVSAFAGFDAGFAGRLMALEDSELLDVRSTLGRIFDEAPDRWRTCQWVHGTHSDHGDADVSMYHTMYDFYLSRNADASVAAEAKRRLDRRYWQACVRAITPWLEERRLQVLQPFLGQLRKRAQSDGKIAIPSGPHHTVEIDPEEVEYNTLTGMVRHQELEKQTQEQDQAFQVARSAKKVRDEIAHGRAPTPRILTEVIRQMDTYCANRA